LALDAIVGSQSPETLKGNSHTQKPIFFQRNSPENQKENI